MLQTVLVLMLLAALPVEAAKQSAVPNRYGAIAYHRPSQSWGVSFDTAKERDASLTALRQCAHKECEVVHKFKNGCAALVDGPKAAVAASGATRDEAETKALKKCGMACKPIAWACTR